MQGHFVERFNKFNQLKAEEDTIIFAVLNISDRDVFPLNCKPCIFVLRFENEKSWTAIRVFGVTILFPFLENTFNKL